MSDEEPISLVLDSEVLARFVVIDKWIREDKTIRHHAFMPPRNLELSVTRHKGFSDKEIWEKGRDVAALRNKKLFGRADFSAQTVRDQKLRIIPDPLPNNVNHANVKGWPEKKEDKKAIALQIAAESVYVQVPD